MATFTGSNGAEIFPDLIIGPVQALGNDFVDALGGDDIAIGWSGDDVIRGGAGADVIIGGLVNAAGVITNSGIDAADYTTSVDGVTIDLSVTVSLTLPMLGVNLQLMGASQGFGGDAQGDFLQGIVNLIGSNTGGDTLSGNSAANTMNGQGGNDTLNGNGGNDILLGGAGDDVLVGGAGADSLQGGAGTNDTADYSGSAAPVTVNLTSGAGSGGDAQGDTLTGIERLIGSAGGDNLAGSAGNDTLVGLAGDDTLLGLGGNDIIQGGTGADVMDGGAGYDTLTFANATAGVGVALNAFGTYGEALGDTMAGFEALIGSAFNDQLAGDGGDNLVDGGDGDDYIQLSGGVDTLIGGAGRDILDGRVIGAAVNANLTTGTGSGGGMAVGTTLSGFEVVLGSAFDDVQTANLNLGTDLVGFDGADTLNGANGDDQLFGDNYAGIAVTGGADTLNGGGGNDRLEGGAFGDMLNGGAGVDTIVYSGSASAVTINLATAAASGGEAHGDTVIDIENVVGSAHGDSLTGAAGVNILTGGAGADILAGLGGADTLNGGAGMDTVDYSASAAGVTIDLGLGATSGGDAAGDTLISIENVSGSAHADRLTGAAGANRLEGGGGNDLLDGLGGGDTLVGGSGDDIYYVDAAGDQTVELASEGADVVRAYLDWTLADNIERLELQGADALSGTGNALDNILLGNAGNNLLVGGEGDDLLNGVAGADTAAGGIGNDRYYVDNAADIVMENSTEGTADRVYASVSYHLAALAEVEILNTRTPAATTEINLTGNEFGQIIIGNAGANIIDGRGGIDTMKGLGGNDTYYVDEAGDIVIEVGGYGTDTLYTTVDYLLQPGRSVEVLSADQASTSSSPLHLTGNNYANTVIGNAGDNFINGGTGQDTLTGGAGNDTFVFDAAYDWRNVDTITDFDQAGNDMIQLESAIFTALTTLGMLAEDAFVANTTGYAQGVGDHIVYETDTGKLIYDENGSAAGGRHLFAWVDPNLSLTHDDFFVV